MTPIVAIRNLNYCFGQGHLQKAVLIDISLDLHPGEIVILMGPSGSGKTTLLTLIGALRSLQSGSLKFQGREMLGVPKRQLIGVRQQIGFIFQSHNLLGCLTAQENVGMSLKLHNHLSVQQRQAHSIGILKAVGLEAHLNDYPANLSGGQKQRVAIARALVSYPKLVLADEPTAALDSQSGRNTVEIMRRLAREEGCTVLLVTHDNRILDMADRILQMEDGQLIS
ncbi:MAG TPA: ATP-binding cassette domain-containing protein [Candidatus Caenarcaniphilales bacterium]